MIWKSWNKAFYSQRVWIEYNIKLAELVYEISLLIFKISPETTVNYSKVLHVHYYAYQ